MTIPTDPPEAVDLPDAAECPWPIDPSCVGDLSGFDDAVIERAKVLATSALRALTAYRVGGCPRTVRPCAESCLPLGVSGRAFTPTLYGGEWLNNGCTCSPSGCGCRALSEVVLHAPVGEIIEVRVDGEVLDATDYRLEQGYRLVRTGGGSWPTCQNLAQPDTEPGTFSVTYVPGFPVDRLGAIAMGVLTAEFAKACGGGKCRLPSGVTSITRQGIQMTVGADAFPNQRTGIREVDVFIERWNPHGLRTAPRVYTPDTFRGRVSR